MLSVKYNTFGPSSANTSCWLIWAQSPGGAFGPSPVVPQGGGAVQAGLRAGFGPRLLGWTRAEPPRLVSSPADRWNFASGPRLPLGSSENLICSSDVRPSLSPSLLPPLPLSPLWQPLLHLCYSLCPTQPAPTYETDRQSRFDA